jgi:hypothetical protein
MFTANFRANSLAVYCDGSLEILEILLFLSAINGYYIYGIHFRRLPFPPHFFSKFF